MNERLTALSVEKGVNPAAILLAAYCVTLSIRKSASLQVGLLLSAFAVILWQHRGKWGGLIRGTWNLWMPLVIFSLWVFLIAPFWQKDSHPLIPDPQLDSIRQPWFSLNLWRRDILQPLLGMLCAGWVFRDLGARRFLFWVQAILVGVTACFCLHQFYKGEIHDGVFQVGTFAVRGLAHDINFLGYLLLLLTPGVLLLVCMEKDGWKRMAAWGALLVLFYLIYLCKRRGTWAGLYVELLVVALWMGRRYWMTYLAMTVVLLVVVWMYRPEWIVRGYDHSQDGISRQHVIEQVQPLLLKHPWVGVGYGKETVVKNYWPYMHQHAHNMFINLALAVGIPGLFLWLGGLGVYAKSLWAMRFQGWGPRIGLAFLLGFMVRNLTDDIWLSSIAEFFWFMMGVLLVSNKEKHES